MLRLSGQIDSSLLTMTVRRDSTYKRQIETKLKSVQTLMSAWKSEKANRSIHKDSKEIFEHLDKSLAKAIS